MDDQSSSSKSSGISSSTTEVKTRTAPNEESLRISTSSSWTILPAEISEIPDNTNGSEESSAAKTKGMRVEKREQEQNIKDCTEHTSKRCKLVEDLDTQAEDVSDGISIISDCESTGRISPHPFLREHLNELNFKFESGRELPSLSILSENSPQIGERRRDVLELDPNERTTVVSYRPPKLLQNGLTAVFYVSATLAILAFFGRLRYPGWQVLVGNGLLVELEQRLVELELQNNLMRAEIDIMSRQLHYLNTLANGQGQAQAQSQSHTQGRKGKTFKAWPGNGNYVDAVDITKEDLKRPYKWSDGKYVIAAMCVKSMPHAESLNDVLQQYQAFHNFEIATERLGTIAGKGAEMASHSDAPKAFHTFSEKVRPPSIDDSRGPVPVSYPKADASNEQYKTKHNHKRQEHSNEYVRNKSNDYNSKKHRNRKQADKSKKRFDKQPAKKRHGQGDDSGSGDWYERMMQHREHSRQRH